MPRKRTLACLLVAGLATLTTGGCAADGSSGASANERAHIAVPSDVAKGGALRVAADISYAPNEFLDDQKNPQGVDYDLAKALADRLGVKLDFHQVAWDDIIPTVSEHKSDLVMSSMTDTAERQKQLTFVDYFVAGSQMVVPKGNPGHITDVASLCGHHIALQAATTHLDLAKAQSTLCVKAGKRPISILETASGENLDAVKAGMADATMDDYPVAAYHVSQDSSALELAGKQSESAPYGIGIAKDRPELRDAVQRALQELIADGTYARILDTWHIKAGSLRTTAIDGGA